MFGISEIHARLNRIEEKLEGLNDRFDESIHNAKKLLKDSEGNWIPMIDLRDRIDEMFEEFENVCRDLKLNDHVELVDKINEKSEDLQQAYDNLRVIMNEVRGDLNIFRLVINKAPKPKVKPVKKNEKTINNNNIDDPSYCFV